MSRRFHLDLTRFLRAPGSTLRRKWTDVAGLTAPLLALRAAPSRALPALATLEAAVAALTPARGRTVLAAGEPSARGAGEVWRDVGSTVSWVRGFDPLPAQPGSLVALLGPGWVDSLAEAAVEARWKVGVVASAEDGEPVEPPPRGIWIEDLLPVAGFDDPLAPGQLVVAGLGGVDVAAALRGAEPMRAAVVAPAGADNPVWSLARALRLAESDLARADVLHVASGAELEGLVRWVVREQNLVPSPGGLQGTPPAFAAACTAGDEGWLEGLRGRGRERTLVYWELSGSDPAWIDAADATGAVSIRVRLPGPDAESVGGAVALWQGAMRVLAVLRGVSAVATKR